MFTFTVWRWTCVALCLMGFVCVDPCLGFWTLSETGATSFRGRTIIVLLLYVILVFWLFTRNLLQPFPLVRLVVIWPIGLTLWVLRFLLLRVDCYDWYDWFPGFFIVTAFIPLKAGEIHGSSEALQSFQLVVVVVVCGVDFLCVLLPRVVYLRWCPIYTTRCSGRVRV